MLIIWSSFYFFLIASATIDQSTVLQSRVAELEIQLAETQGEKQRSEDRSNSLSEQLDALSKEK